MGEVMLKAAREHFIKTDSEDEKNSRATLRDAQLVLYHNSGRSPSGNPSRPE